MNFIGGNRAMVGLYIGRYYSDSSERLILCLSVLFIALFIHASPSHAQCLTPAGVEAEMDFDETNNIMRYCDGTDWWDIGGSRGSDGSGNADPAIVGNYQRLTGVQSLKVSGNYLYFVSEHSDTFGVLDMTTRNDVTMHASVSDPIRMDVPKDMDIEGNYAYVATQGSDHLVVIDITDPSSPYILSTFSATSDLENQDIEAIDVEGNYAYVITDDHSTTRAKLQIFDISTPSVPTERGYLDDAGGNWDNTKDILVSGNYAYLTSIADDNVVVVDISDPDAPTERGSVAVTDPSHMAINGTTLFVDSNDDYIHALDVSDPDAPTVLDSFSLDTLSAMSWDDDNAYIVYDSGYLYVAQENGETVILDVSTPSAIVSRAYNSDPHHDHDGAGATVLDSGYLYSARDNLRITDVSDPDNIDQLDGWGYYFDIRILDRYSGAGPYGDIAFALAYGPSNTTEVHVLDFSDPLNVLTRGSVTVSDQRLSITFDYEAPYFYMATDDHYTNNELTIIDVSDPDVPVVVSQLGMSPTVTHIDSMDVSGDYAYFIGGDEASSSASKDVFGVIDITDRASPSLESSYLVPSFSDADEAHPHSVNYDSRGYVYVGTNDTSTGDGQISVIDVSNPAVPSEVETLTTTNADNYEFLVWDEARQMLYFNSSTTDTGRMSLIDASDPLNLSALGETPTHQAHRGSVRAGDYLYTTSYEDFIVYDVSDPTAVTEAFSLEDYALDNTGAFHLFGNYVFVDGGWLVIDPGTNYGAGDPGEAAVCVYPHAKKGAMNYDYEENQMKICNGNRWEPLRSTCAVETLGACGTEGVMEWNGASSSYRWCNGTNWIKADSGIPAGVSIGDTCDDGTVYAGTSPDGGFAMYAARCDAGMTWDGASCTGTRALIPWDDGVAGNDTATGLNDVNEGRVITMGLVTNDAWDSNNVYSGKQDFSAAKYCYDHSEGGYSDWYLPAEDELDVIYDNRASISGINPTVHYYSSTEASATDARRQDFATGTQSSVGKENAYFVRCVRRDG